MIPQNKHNVASSAMLYIENKILTKGSGYYPVTANFYDVTDSYVGYESYSAPYASIVADESLPGVQLMTGVYSNNTFIGPGQSGLDHIDYKRGQLHFSTGTSNTLSGNFYVKEYEFRMTHLGDNELLFDTKYFRRPRYLQTPTGFHPGEVSYPIIYIRTNGGVNEQFQFGGDELTRYYIRGTVISDSLYSLDAVLSIVQDLNRSYIPLINSTGYPFDEYGDYKNGTVYNYTGLTANANPDLFIDRVYANKFQDIAVANQKSLPKGAVIGSFDLDISQVRNPRA
jgi:hypothetical protein